MVYNVEGVDENTKRFFNQLADALFRTSIVNERDSRANAITREEVVVEINRLCRLWDVTAKQS